MNVHPNAKTTVHIRALIVAGVGAPPKIRLQPAA